MNEDNPNGLVKIGALWKNEKGLSGKMGSARVFIFENKYKKEEKQPDYTICVANPVKKEEPNKPGVDDHFNF